MARRRRRKAGVVKKVFRALNKEFNPIKIHKRHMRRAAKRRMYYQG